MYRQLSMHFVTDELHAGIKECIKGPGNLIAKSIMF